jgi:hypothetical protein
MYTTSPETHIKDLARKWNTYCRFEYIRPSFPSSILNQIPVSFSHLLSLSGYLVVFPKMSQCAHWQTHGFTFALVLLYRDSNRPLAIRCLGTFQIVDSWADELYIALPLFRDLQTTPGSPRYTNLLPHSHIIPSSMIHSMHMKVSRPAI